MLFAGACGGERWVLCGWFQCICFGLQPFHLCRLLFTSIPLELEGVRGQIRVRSSLDGTPGLGRIIGIPGYSRHPVSKQPQKLSQPQIEATGVRCLPLFLPWLLESGLFFNNEISLQLTFLISMCQLWIPLTWKGHTLPHWLLENVAVSFAPRNPRSPGSSIRWVPSRNPWSPTSSLCFLG